MKLIRIIEKNERFILNHVQDDKGRQLVVKSFAEEFPGLESMAQLKNEGDIGRSLSHEGIRSIHQEVFFNNRKCLSMEFIEGENIRSKGPMDLMEFFRFSIEITKTLEYIHGKGIIHRDISAYNILHQIIDNKYTIIDFGTAVRKEAHVIPQNLIGTPAYVSPELSGRLQLETDQRADLYSLGVVFYEMLTGINPFSDKSEMQIIYKHLAWMPEAPDNYRPELPVTLCKIVLKLLEKDREKRYLSAAGLLHDLEEAMLLFQRNVSPSAFEPGSSEKPPPFSDSPENVANHKIQKILSDKREGLLSGKTKFLYLKGPKGSGKTHIINQLIPDLIEDQVLYVRIDSESKKSKPYAYLFELLNEILNKINEEPDDFLLKRKTRFLSDEVSDVSFLADRLPSLGIFIEASAPTYNPNTLQSQNRFQLALQDLFKILAIPERPMTLHLTGVENLDTESKDFLVEFSEDLRDEYIWIILEENTDQLIEHSRVDNKSITLGRMTNEVLMKVFKSMVGGTVLNENQIVDQLFKYSKGLPGKTVEIINYWYSNNFLQYDHKRAYWYWAEQKARSIFPESIVSKIEIESAVQEDIIEWAKLIDEKFTLKMLNALSTFSAEELRNGLERLNINGQIISYRNATEYYSLTRITEGFISRLEENIIAQRHNQIVEYLLNLEARDHYRIAHHMNKSLAYGQDLYSGNPSLIANLQAGLDAKREGAFKLGRSYFKSALEQLSVAGELSFQTLYKLFLNSAELAQIDGDYDEAERLYIKALGHASDDIEKAQVFSRQVSLYNHQGKLDKSFNSGRQALKFLGMPIPEKAGNVQIFIHLAKIWLKIGWKDPNLLKELPPLKDKRIVMGLQILQDLQPAMFNISNELLFFTLLIALQKQLKHGNAPEGGYAYSGFGAILAIGFNNFKKGWAFTEVGYEIVEKFEGKKFKASALSSKAGWLINYVEHSRNGIPLLEEAFKLNKEVGDFSNASFCVMFLSEAYFMAGYPVVEFEKKINEFISFTYQNGYDDMLGICLITKRYLLQLTERESEVDNLDKEWFRSKNLVEYTKESSFKHLRAYYLILDAYWQYYNGRFETADSHIKEIETLLHTLKGPAIIVDYYFIKGLINYEMAKSGNDKKIYEKQLKKTVRKLNKYNKLIEDNFSHRYLVIEGLAYQLRGKYFKARRSMRKALSLARKYDFAQVETTAAIYLARWFNDFDQKGYSRLHFMDSINAAEKWGANFLVKSFKKEFAEFGTYSQSASIGDSSGESHSSKTSHSGVSNPDLLMQSVLSVSSETDFESLLNAMNQIFLEQAGATRSLLFITSKNELNLLYEMESDQRTYHPYPGISTKGIQTIPKTILQLVMRVMKTIVIEDTSRDQHFRFETYFRNKPGFSVMVVPMLYRGQLSGILYFENTMLTNAFPSARKELITLLSGQFAVSLQNAQLVEELEQRVRERTEALASEKDRADLLLKNILPTETAEELKHRGIATPRYYKNVTVLFTDFEGFTRISENMPPQELVKMLDFYFKEFDNIITELGLEKIKTIGDSYLCVAGLPVENKNHVQMAAKAAVKILNFVTETSKKGHYQLKLRIGMHSGPVIAGVVGKNKFAYDIWGDTVNTASRMETNSAAGKINISKETKDLLQDTNKYNFSYRGKVEAKNKGEIDMYFLEENDDLKVDHKAAIKMILDKMKSELSDDLKYHSFDHTCKIISNVEKIGKSEGLNEEEMMLLATAAAFHDSGFIHTTNEHEAKSAELAGNYLPEYGFSQSQIDQIKKMIMATKIPQQPLDLPSKVLCDADLYYLGTDSFFETGEKLFIELSKQGVVKTRKDWLSLQIRFLESHKYHTKTVISECKSQKLEHLESLKKMLNEIQQ
jgi:class 3 adenylate cyclase/serine/threonine protein kinase